MALLPWIKSSGVSAWSVSVLAMVCYGTLNGSGGLLAQVDDQLFNDAA